MAISAKEVMKLRKLTGAGMMDCKKALGEAEGDFDRAVEVIRERGKAIANKRADRDASEGVVLSKVSADGKFGATLALNCETDFVAKNESYIAFVAELLDAAIEAKATDLAAVNALALRGSTIESVIAEQTGVVGEKLEISFYGTISAEMVVPYIHAGNMLSTMIGFSKEIDLQAGKDVAMQAAAMAPIAIDKDQIPQETIDSELKIAMEKFRQEGKPEAMLEKISQGSLNKWFKENTLLNQAFVKDGKITVAAYLKSVDADVKVTDMVRYTLNA